MAAPNGKTPASTTPSPATNFVFHGDDQAAAPVTDSQEVSWTASEFVSQQKSMAWFIVLALSAVLIAAIVYVLNKDVISSVVVIIMAVIFGVLAARQPRTLTYSLSGRGLQIDAKQYPYELFKSFSVQEEGALDCVVLMPMKRFMPPLTVYFTPEDEDKVLNVLGMYLPLENRKRDLIDQAMRKIRF